MRRAYFGFAGQRRPLDRRLARAYNLPNRTAVEIMAVEPGSPAARAGLREADIVVAVEDRPVAGVDDVQRFLTAWPIGQPVTLAMLRRAELLRVAVAPAESP